MWTTSPIARATGPVEGHGHQTGFGSSGIRYLEQGRRYPDTDVQDLGVDHRHSPLRSAGAGRQGRSGAGSLRNGDAGYVSSRKDVGASGWEDHGRATSFRASEDVHAGAVRVNRCSESDEGAMGQLPTRQETMLTG